MPDVGVEDAYAEPAEKFLGPMGCGRFHQQVVNKLGWAAGLNITSLFVASQRRNASSLLSWITEAAPFALLGQWTVGAPRARR